MTDPFDAAKKAQDLMNKLGPVHSPGGIKVTVTEKKYEGMPHKDEDDSGGSCGYYEVLVCDPFLYHERKEAYLAECGEIIEALNMTPIEANIMKEIWRTASARQGKSKKGNNPVRAAEKIYFHADRMLKIAKHNEENK